MLNFFGLLCKLKSAFGNGFEIGRSTMFSDSIWESTPFDFSSASDSLISNDDAFGGTWVNPANGNLMIGGIGGVDTAGNPYGMDFHHDTSSVGNMDTCSIDFNSTFESSSFDNFGCSSSAFD